MDEKEWINTVQRILKQELFNQDLKRQDLVKKLQAIGVKENEKNINNKISRGKFSAIFLLQCCQALGIDTISLKK